MLELLVASACMIINGIEYCPTQTPANTSIPTTVRQPTAVPQPVAPTTQPNGIIEERVTISAPIYQLNNHTMTDPRYGQMYFDYSSVKEQNDCTESLLFLLEGRSQRGDATCANRVASIFGAAFGTDPTVTENIFRMQAHYTRSILKREFKLPLGLDRRLQIATGLSAEQ